MSFEFQNFTADGAASFFACACGACAGKGLGAIAHGGVGTLSASLAQAAADAVPSSVMVTSDGRILGRIAAGETDSYTLNVVAGQTYAVAVRGVGSDALDDTFLGVFDQSGAAVGFDDDGGLGTSSLFTFTAAASGTYRIGVAGFVNDGVADTGDYQLDIWQQRAADQVPGARSGLTMSAATRAGAVTTGLGTTFGFIETSLDTDVYKVFLEAGKLYTFDLAGGADYEYASRDLVKGELDTIIAIYDASGARIARNDDINFPNDASSSTAVFVQESGFYYIDARAYAGETGGYTLDVQQIDLSTRDPLNSLDWRSADNIDTVLVNGVRTAYVYFGDSDENFGQTNDAGTGPMITIDWNDFEKGQVMQALEEYERILGIDYVVTDNAAIAEFRLLKTESQEYGAYFFPQDPVYGASEGVGVFNVLSGGWNLPGQESLLRGGFSYAVILHEFGHAHGVAHPHDNGGGSEVMLGVTASTGSYGLFDLNQGVYTVMSYNDAWVKHPDGPSPYTRATIDHGWSGTLGAFDIGILQRRYGVTERNTGNDVYRLQDANDKGTFYSTIWDSAGTDEIRYDGARATRIDLLAATLDYSPTGGGVVSFVDDIWGGYTIANGVVIENAAGGSGADQLLGNAAANLLTGNAGDDVLVGRGGADTLDGGAGTDTASYVDAASGVRVTMTGGGAGTASDGDRLISIERVTGSAFADTLAGGSTADFLFGAAGDDQLSGGIGFDTLDGGAGADLLDGGNGNDALAGGAGDDRLQGGTGADTFVFAGAGGTDTIVDFRRGDLIDLSGLAGVDRSDVTISAGRIFVENGDDDIVILIQGDAVTDAALLFGTPPMI